MTETFAAPPERLFESSAIVVINKTAGVLTQAPPGIDSVEVRLRRWLETLRPDPYVGCLHRLDRPVSGCLAFGLSRNATRKVAEQFERREVRKTYWALVAGHAEPQAGRWIDWMRKVPDEPRSELAAAGSEGAREAILNYQTKEIRAEFSLLEITLETGRTHQIRLQCSARVGPLLGDSLYGSEWAFGPSVSDDRERCIALHARSLELYDPGTKQRVECIAPLPQYWGPFLPDPGLP